MKVVITIVLLSFLFTACKKDKYTVEPQIDFIKFSPNQGNNRGSLSNQPYLVFELRDEDGDIDEDTARIFVKNTLTNKLDSFKFPDLKADLGKNFKGEIQVGLFSVMAGRNLPSTQRPYLDTLSFELYVRDKARNKSNVVLAAPFYYTTLP